MFHYQYHPHFQLEDDSFGAHTSFPFQQPLRQPLLPHSSRMLKRLGFFSGGAQSASYSCLKLQGLSPLSQKTTSFYSWLQVQVYFLQELKGKICYMLGGLSCPTFLDYFLPNCNHFYCLYYYFVCPRGVSWQAVAAFLRVLFSCGRFSRVVAVVQVQILFISSSSCISYTISSTSRVRKRLNSSSVSGFPILSSTPTVLKVLPLTRSIFFVGINVPLGIINSDFQYSLSLTILCASAWLMGWLLLATRELIGEQVGRQFVGTTCGYLTVDFRSAFSRGWYGFLQQLPKKGESEQRRDLVTNCPDFSNINNKKYRCPYIPMQISEQKTIDIHPYRRGKIRFLVLFLLSMIVFSTEFAFNNPQALEVNMEKDLGIGETQFQLLYTIFAFPNIFATLFIGILIDYLGVRICLVALISGVVVFQFVIAMGGYAYDYTTILIGRMLFGLSSQSIVTAFSCLISIWFKGKELSLAFGIAVTFPQFGSALNSSITPLIYEKTQSLGAPLLFSVFMTLIGLICALISVYIDKQADKYDEQHKIIVHDSNEEDEEKRSFSLKDFKRLTPTFWLLISLCMFSVGSYVPFLDGANKLFVESFCFTPVTAGRALVVTYLISATCSPPIGMLIDYFGYKRFIIMGMMASFTIAHLIILVFPQCIEGGLSVNGAISGLALLGLCYTMYGNCLVPCISIVVKKRIVGTAFGIMLMVESIALAFFPLINGVIIERGQSKGYRNSSLFFTLMSLAAFLLSLCLFIIPDKLKRKLDHSSRHSEKVKEGEHGELIFTTESEESSAQVKAKQTIEIVDRSAENLQANLLTEGQKNNDL